MTNEIIPTEQEIQNLIFEVRGQQVMIDLHLAQLYQVETRVLKQAVRRNIDRFPDDFMFHLTSDEANQLISIGVSQSVIPPGYNVGAAGMFAFTEEGVSMLASVLRSPIAIKMSIAIIRAFVVMRNQLLQLANTNLQFENLRLELQNQRMYIDELLRDQNDINEDVRLQLDNINDALAQLMAEKSQKLLNDQRPRIGFHVTDDNK